VRFCNMCIGLCKQSWTKEYHKSKSSLNCNGQRSSLENWMPIDCFTMFLVFSKDGNLVYNIKFFTHFYSLYTLNNQKKNEYIVNNC